VLESLSESCNPAGVSAHDNPQSTPHRYRCVFTPEKQV